MDFVCSAFANQAATSYCGVACMIWGGGVHFYVKNTVGFNDIYVQLHSTTCLSGGYPVTLTCWPYTKHWSLNIFNYYSNMDSCNVTMDMVSQAAPPLLYNYLRTKNTLQLFLWFFFCLVFWTSGFPNWTVLSKREMEVMKRTVWLREPSTSPCPWCLWKQSVHAAVVNCTSTGWRAPLSRSTQACIRTAVGQHGTNYPQYRQHCVWA